jgi:hypothetical protein
MTAAGIELCNFLGNDKETQKEKRLARTASLSS